MSLFFLRQSQATDWLTLLRLFLSVTIFYYLIVEKIYLGTSYKYFYRILIIRLVVVPI